MGLEDADFSSEWESSGAEQGQEQAHEQREKVAEKAKKSAKKLMHMRGDQRKAQKSDDALYRLLQAFINEPQYEILLPSIVTVLSKNIPSHVIIGVISLVYRQAEEYIFDEKNRGKPEVARSIFPYADYTNRAPVVFHGDLIEFPIRTRIMGWVDDITFLLAHDPSLVTTQSLFYTLMDGEKRSIIQMFIRDVFIFFIRSLSYTIDTASADVYARFIMERIEKKVDSVFSKWIQNTDEADFLHDEVDIEKDGSSLFFGE